MATCCVQPIDMVKVRLQLAGGGNPVTVASKLIADEGFLALYGGLSAGLLRQVTYGMTRLGLFRTLTNRYEAKYNVPASKIPFVATSWNAFLSNPMEGKLQYSIIAGGIAALTGTPADAALVRMQADSTLPAEQRRNYKNGVDAMIRMAREEGVRGFFSGATPTIVRGLAVNVGMLTTYDSFKDWFGPSLPGGRDGQASRFVNGFLSGWVAATLSLPFDYVKTQLQKDAEGRYKGMLDCARKTMAEGGIAKFYSGYPTFVVRITPHIMLTWVFMDNIKAGLTKMGL